METRLSYRFLPRVWGVTSVDYNDAPTRPDVRAASPSPQVRELLLKWGPESVEGLTLSLGKLRLYGQYSALFDQNPLENFQFTGLAADYNRRFSETARLRLRLAAGREFLGRTQYLDRYIFANGSNSQSLYYAFLDGSRERYHLYGTGRWTAGGFHLGLLAGFQTLPRDSSFTTDQDVINAPTGAYRAWPRSSGGQVGGEAGYQSRNWHHHLIAAHGRGDVAMGWSRPDAVLDTSIAPLSGEQRFSRRGSSLTHVVYWGGLGWERIRLEAGAWWQNRAPSARWAVSYPPNASGGVDTFRVRAQEFRVIKYSAQPSMALTDFLKAGVRYDRIDYWTPGAHANTVEPAANTTLIRETDRDPAEPLGPSLWDREAVDCDILSPYAELDFGDGFHARISWSGAWYERDVWRQGRAHSFHSNATVSAWLTYQFQKPFKPEPRGRLSWNGREGRGG